MTSFRKLYFESTSEELTNAVLNKLNLYSTDQKKKYPTNAMILFSDDQVRSQIFPYAKIECARFKGTIPGDFIDQESVETNIGLHAEIAYKFVLRNIAKGSEYEGVYRKDRWEYPIVAIREIIRNAVVHRDYSLKGKDIKVAVFDDKIEITSPGMLLPSINFDEMESGQSDIRNKCIASVFKKMGVIEQWGSGLKLIVSELKKYPDIELKWSEPSLSFRITLSKKDFVKSQEIINGTKKHQEAPSWHQVSTKLALSKYEIIKILKKCAEPVSFQDVMDALGWKDRTKFRNKYIKPLLAENLLNMTDPASPKSPKQKYFVTERGNILIKENKH